jgi:aryl-alcohol dehydrogenase-like predicted oxidoreductase
MSKGDSMDKHDRRGFLKKAFFGTLAAPSLAKNLLSSEKQQIIRKKKGEMYYRKLGRTGLNISEISLGGSPLPDKAIFHQVVERGVNFIDTSHSYSNGNSERQIGNFFKEAGRDKVYVSTKFHVRGNFDKNAIIKSVEGSLTRLQTDYIDVLLIHGVDDENHLTDERVVDAFETLKKQGKYRFRGISCHSNHHKVATKAVECGFFDMLLLGYNIFDIKETDTEIEVYDDYLEACGLRKIQALAKSKDVGIIAIKTLKIGGRRQNLTKYKEGTTSIYQAMLRWALDNKDIASAAIEMLTFSQMEEDLAVVRMPILPAWSG